MTALVGIVCDGCGATRIRETVQQVSVGPARDAAKKVGWHRAKGTYEAINGKTYGYARDVCPDCWSKGVR